MGNFYYIVFVFSTATVFFNWDSASLSSGTSALAGFAITFGGGPFVSDLAENRSETVSDLSENRSETKVGDTRPGQEPKENS